MAHAFNIHGKDSRKDSKEIIVGLDIGTTKISAIVGEVNENGIDIIGIGTQLSSGLRKGVIINIDSTVESIKKAIKEAELMAGCEIKTVYAGIGGSHVTSFNSHGIVAIKDREISSSDVARVIDAARAVAIPQDREVLHVIPQEFIIDEQDGIREPVGMSGVRLEAKVHIVSGAVTSAHNIIKSCNKAGLNVTELVFEPIAAAESVLSEDEKELGVMLVDVGGGTTNIAIYSQGAIVYTSVLSIGGNHITNDIAVGLRTPQHEAEKIKLKHGCSMASIVNSEETIEVPGVGGRKPRTVPKKLLSEIIEPRVEELCLLVRKELESSGFSGMVASGIVLTGGSVLLEGFPELAEFVFDMPVKRGHPLNENVGGLKDVVSGPKFATGLGLLQYSTKRQMMTRARNSNRFVQRISSHPTNSIFPAIENRQPQKDRFLSSESGKNFTKMMSNVGTSMRDWIKDLF